MASKVTKVRTGIACLDVNRTPHRDLLGWYRRILIGLKKMPQDYAYRSITEKLINERKSIVEATPDPAEIERKIGIQCEEIIEEAKCENSLVQDLLKHKAWEPLEQKPPANQWKWPM